ncbi:MAG: MATE family efflux transporter [Lachnospiraceae bacterium]|jgi:putative MATE family efflux protein|nr:polysaccharide biosynthesis C-terminal domain-containing protein [Lachnospiraceae bacterium]MCI1397138.1 MATE family efflux transporter [Lachnospiraceae bacterium]MCI1422776.1 MATE family efflux transporter [Lachnospiraceae bacterium]MCI1451535.1 MATE family efflux transporter [Lachnospiraceae bacterium]MDD5848688.1 MATE family efflux transporter [Bacillota bacterium]
MDFLKTDVRQVYRRYLLPTLGSALAMSIYSIVDTIAVGQYAGPVGTAALAVVNPVYVIMVVIAFLCATGGSVRFGNALGAGDTKRANAFFTGSLVLCCLITLAAWAVFWRWYREIFAFFGANGEVLPTACAYGVWIIRFFPVIVAPDFLASFLRMDRDPHRALAAVMTGGCLNMFLDWFLVFPMGMGVEGAAIATVIGTLVQCIIMLSHFFSPKNHLHLVRFASPLRTMGRIISAGISASVLDLGNVFLAFLMNRQIMRYGSTAVLGVYGVINTNAILFQALFAGVGQTIQPGVSVNYGAGDRRRVRSFYRYGIRTALGMGAAFALLGELFPAALVRLFMKATPEALAVAPVFVRCYFVSFPFLGYLVVTIYYLQSVLQKTASTAIALGRAFVFPEVFLLVLPPLLGLSGVYAALPAAEILLFALTALLQRRHETKRS